MAEVFLFYYFSMFLSDVKILDRSIFDFIDFLTNSIGMPIGTLLISSLQAIIIQKIFLVWSLPHLVIFFWNILIQSPIGILFFSPKGSYLCLNKRPLKNEVVSKLKETTSFYRKAKASLLPDSALCFSQQMSFARKRSANVTAAA